MYASPKSRGFTLIEILIAVAIVAILASIVLMGMDSVRKKARDTQRTSDVAQIHVALRSYAHAFGEYPAYPNGVRIENDGPFSELAPYLQDGIQDPLNEDVYQYYYDSAYTCNGASHVVVIARTLEASGTGNYEEVCGTSATALGAGGITPTDASYIRIVR